MSLSSDTHGRSPALVELRAVSKSFREADLERSVLTEVDLILHPGEFVVLLGKSGSGKSTLLNLISGMDVPSSGDVYLAGNSLAQLSEEERTRIRRKQVGFVFQGFNLLPILTAEENVLLPLELNGRPSAVEREYAAELLRLVGLKDRRHQFPDRLSGGEQQRVAVARALVHRPAVVLADEPTGNLDEEIGRQVLDLLEQLSRSRTRTVLVATHDREMVSRADRVLRLAHGRLMEAPKLRVVP